jgi:hypothetical protein
MDTKHPMPNSTLSTARISPPSKLRAWLQLMRIPNLFTVPGDPLAGVCVAIAFGAGVQPDAVFFVVLAAMFLYIAGLLSNDYFDLEVDRRERPARPLPSGLISPASALAASVMFGATGVVAAFLGGRQSGLVAILLLAAIAFYNVIGKRIAVVGPLSMGLCRGLSLAMGGAVARPVPCAAIGIAAAGAALYIAAVTAIAARETEVTPLGFRRWLPCSAVGLTFAAFYALATPSCAVSALGLTTSVGLAGVSFYWAWRCGRKLACPQVVIPSVIGTLIRGLLPIQAAFAVLAVPYGTAAGCLLLCLWPVSALLGRRFYAS